MPLETENGKPETDGMAAPPADYDDRYLRGVLLFNAGAYFAAHEEWEELWTDCPAADRRFYQSLIQAAVALYHWGNRNRPGAARLFASGRRYMEPYRPTYRGLDVDAFWEQVRAALAPALEASPGCEPGESAAAPPRIALTPEPAAWPDPGVRHD
jgi:predicted metal-dependent hydrolase